MSDREKLDTSDCNVFFKPSAAIKLDLGAMIENALQRKRFEQSGKGPLVVRPAPLLQESGKPSNKRRKR